MDKKNILVIEDDQRIQRTVRRILEAEGYAVDCAEKIETGWEHLKQREYDLVIHDILLKGTLDGESFKITSDFMRYGGLKAKKILIMSAYPFTSEKIRQFTSDDMVVDFMPKPFTKNELLNTVKKTLNQAARPPGNPFKA